MNRSFSARLTLFLVLAILFVSPTSAETVRLAVTTSFNNSGLSDVLLPAAEGDLGLRVDLLIVGTGQAIKLGENGDVDAILVHSRNAEEAFVAEGFGTHRTEIMYNDFVLVGPLEDPAGVRGAATILEALALIAEQNHVFVSRGDDSGTHRRERSLWDELGKEPGGFDAIWYREVGAGMGATLNTATSLDAYVLADRGSWLNFGNKDGMDVVFSGDPRLFNQYAFLPVDPIRFPHVNAEAARRLEAWLVSETGKSIIADYRIAGESVFVPNASSSAD